MCKMTQWITRPSGLVDRRELPELTLSAAIDRSCEVPEGKVLLRPKPEEFLPTYPVDGPWGFAPVRIPWAPAYPLAEFL